MASSAQLRLARRVSLVISVLSFSILVVALFSSHDVDAVVRLLFVILAETAMAGRFLQVEWEWQLGVAIAAVERRGVVDGERAHFREEPFGRGGGGGVAVDAMSGCVIMMRHLVKR